MEGRNNWLGALYLTVAASIWGGMYVVSKYVMEYIPPLTLIWIRYVIAFLILFLVLRRSEGNEKVIRLYPLRGEDWASFALIGFVGYFISITLQFVGTKLANAHLGALITSASPAFILLFAGWILREAITKRKLLSLLLASSGVLVVIGRPTELDDSFIGSLYLLGAAVTWALFSVLVKKVSARHSALTITTYALLFALFFMTPGMLWELQVTAVAIGAQLLATPWVIPGILYIGLVATALAFFLWNRGLELMEAGIGSLFFFFQPVVGAFLGWLLLGEQLSFHFYLGAVLILMGVGFAMGEGRALNGNCIGENKRMLN